MMLQSAVLGLGAYLVIHQEATAGIIIASSILSRRALAPVELAIANWKGFVAAREAGSASMNSCWSCQAASAPMHAAAAAGAACRSRTSARCRPASRRLVVHDINFALEAGRPRHHRPERARANPRLARSWSASGRRRGASAPRWRRTRPVVTRGTRPHIGYLPQDVELFDGTVAENIARFEPDTRRRSRRRGGQARRRARHDPEACPTATTPRSATPASASRLASASGSPSPAPSTAIPSWSSSTSRTRISTARARRRCPQAILSVRARGGIVVVIAHRANALGSVSHVLVLHQGRQQAFGAKEEVLRAVMKAAATPLTVVPSVQGGSP